MSSSLPVLEIARAANVSQGDVAKILDYLGRMPAGPPGEGEPSPDSYGTLLRGSIARLQESREAYRAELDAEHVPPLFPSQVQLQTIAGCNASCVMCAMSVPAIRRQQRGRMSDELFARIVSECASRPECEEIALYLQNEPLLDQALARRVREVKEASGGRIAVRIVTNGSLLSPARAKELIDAGLDRIAVSLNAFTPQTYRTVMGGLDYDTTKRNIEALLACAPAHLLVTLTFMVTTVNRHEIEEAVDYWSARGVLCGAYEINTMAGTVQDFDVLHVGAGRQRKECYLPLEALPILNDGSALLCCTDWSRASIAGNARDESLADIWNGPLLSMHRRNALRERFDHPICQRCLGQTRVAESLMYDGTPVRPAGAAR